MQEKSMFQWLQKYPHFLEILYDLTESGLSPFKRWLKPGGRLEKFVTVVEKNGKKAVFNCKMCGQCILHNTGMTCPMNCPKHLRNGPCGGVRLDGNCEVKPQSPCVWVLAYERSLKMPKYGPEFARLQPPMNNQLKSTSSWINMFHGVDVDLPAGWMSTDDLPVMRSQGVDDGD
jgi:hypothetical protein